jgi:hypothetical protein
LPGLIHFLRCVGRAALRNSGRALAGLVPFGATAYEIVEEAFEEYRRDHTEAQLRAELDALARAPVADVRRAAEEVAAEQAPDQPAEVRLALESYLDSLPAALPEPAPAPPATDKALVAGGGRCYRLAGMLSVGDVADVHLAHAEPSSAGAPSFVLKASRVPEGYALLGNERRTLAHLLSAARGATYRHYLPALTESFGVADRFPRRVNVFAHEPGWYTLEQVRERHAALDGRHLGWVFNRLLTVLGFCHSQGVLHAAVLPCHVLLHPEGHGLRLVGWGQSVAAGRLVHTVPTRYRDWYPPEVRGKKPAAPATDVFLAARCLIYLAGGDPVADRMPGAASEPMRRFVRACLLEGVRMRPGDAWALQDEFAGLLRRLYGPPKFHHLDMN